MSNDYETARAERAPALDDFQASLAKNGAQFIQVHLPDINGNFRTKIAPFKISSQGEAVNCNFFCTAPGEGAPLLEPLFPAEVSSEANGFPNMRGLIDPATVRQHEWAPEWASAIVDSFEIAGRRNPLDLRGVIARHEKRAADLGYEVKFALEYEFGIFEIDEEKMRAGRYRDLKPWGHGDINYSLMRSKGFQVFFAELIRRLKGVGITLAAVTTEYGYGMYEYALGPKSPLEAADDAVRAKIVLQELCLEHGLTATFMARFQPLGTHSASGAHHHQSLWKDGRNVTATGENQLSAVGRHYLGGLLQHLPASHLAFRPNINSYRRFDRGAWSPTTIGWGHEDRTKSIRAITIPSEPAARFEHRVPGSDINPYLSVAMMLAAGLDGIEKRLDPDAIADRELPDTLDGSIALFEKDAFVTEALGSGLQAHYAASRHFEAAAFKAWLDRHITDFEFQRYFAGL